MPSPATAIMRRSFAPSPIAIVRESATPGIVRPAAERLRFDLGIHDCAVDLAATAAPPATARRFARHTSAPRAGAIVSRISWKPPETTPTRPPRSCTALISSRTPGVGSMRASTCANADTGTPASARTRERRLVGEIDLAAHRGLGGRGDFGSTPGLVGDELDDLVADQRGVGIEDHEEAGGCRGHDVHRTGTRAPEDARADGSALDDGALPDDGDAALGDREAAREVALAIDADRRAVVEDDVLVEDRAVDAGVRHRRARGRTAPSR